MKYLIESALLTHGLKSVTNEALSAAWTLKDAPIAWVDAGRICIDTMEAFLAFRTRSAGLIRIDCHTLDQALAGGLSGALTASGTMAVCQKFAIPLAVTCGMGGIGNIKNEKLCPDLPALATLPVMLISTGPKDMLDRQATFRWLADHGVTIVGNTGTISSGYIFRDDPIQLDGPLCPATAHPPLLIINEIPEEKRVQDKAILETAIAAGKQAEREGRYFHPAVNGKIDDLTGGYSSRVQLLSLLGNAKLAKNL